MNYTTKNLEDSKKIDLDAPLRSLRRHSVETAAAAKVSSATTTFSAPPARNNPPPRRFSLPFYKSEEKSGPVRNPGTVPFLWEQSPGRPKNGSDRIPPVAPKPPPAKPSDSVRAHQKAAIFLASKVAAASPGAAMKPDSGKVATEAVHSDNDEDDEDDDDDVFADAPDTLSRTQSFFMNCSVNGVGSFREDPEPPAEPRVQDYMIARFLPAAQALASGSPQYAFRKAATPSRDPAPRTTDRIVSESLRSSPLILYQRKRKEGDDDDHNVEEEDEEEDYRRPAFRGCGLLPKLSLKSSFCLLNPFPGMKRRARPPRPKREEIHSPSPIKSSEREVPHLWEAVYRHKQMQADRSPLEDEHRNSTSDSQTADGTSPYRRWSAPSSPFGEGKRFLGAPIRETGSRELEANDRKQREPDEQQNPPKAEQDRGFSPLQSPLLTPRSPSESWLLSTLPSVSSKTPKPGSFLGLHFQPRKQAAQACQLQPATKPSAARPPKPQHRQIRFAEVLGRPPSAKSQI